MLWSAGQLGSLWLKSLRAQALIKLLELRDRFAIFPNSSLGREANWGRDQCHGFVNLAQSPEPGPLPISPSLLARPASWICLIRQYFEQIFFKIKSHGVAWSTYNLNIPLEIKSVPHWNKDMKRTRYMCLLTRVQVIRATKMMSACADDNMQPLH